MIVQFPYARDPLIFKKKRCCSLEMILERVFSLIVPEVKLAVVELVQ